MRHWFIRWPRALVAALAVSLIACVVTASLTWRLEQNDLQSLREHASLEATNHANALQRSMERDLSATYTLAMLVQHDKGVFRDFDVVASKMLAFYPGASSLQLAPAGVVQHVVPLVGNEQAIGHDLLRDPTRTKAAFLARDTGKLTLDGPFSLVQGGVGVVGRLPVFLDDAKGSPFFWGFTNVLIRFPEAVEVARFTELGEQGFAWELWRIHPDTGQKQIIAQSRSVGLIEPVEKTLKVPNATWTLSVMPVRGWFSPLRLFSRAALSLLFSLLLGYVVKLLIESMEHEKGLEALVTERTAEVMAREADLNYAQSVAQVGSWVLDLATNELRGSVEALRLIGVSGSAAINYQSFLKLVHPDDREIVDPALRAALKGKPYDVEYRILAHSGMRWVRSRAELTVDSEGKLSKALGTLQDITDKKRGEAEIKRYIAELETAFMSTVEVATTLSEMRDPYTAGHSQRVGQIASAMGAELGFDLRRQEGLRVAGYLHDIGKITIPAEILSKPGKLNPVEYLLIKGHAQASYDVLKGVAFPWPVAEVARQHHERLDGSGYPQSLKGESILLEARILAVADVIEAMSSHRPYRAGLGIDKALAEIEHGSGSAYDPQVVEACLRLFREKGYTIAP